MFIAAVLCVFSSQQWIEIAKGLPGFAVGSSQKGCNVNLALPFGKGVKNTCSEGILGRSVKIV